MGQLQSNILSVMDAAQLAQIDSVCDKLYNSTDANERRIAEEAVAMFSTVDGVDACQMILEYSASPFSQHAAASSLKKSVLVNWQLIPEPKRQEIRAYLLNFIANKSAGLAPFVINALIGLISCVIKLGWLDSEENREVVNQLLQFVNTSVDHCLMGLQLLHAVVQEMNNVSPVRSMTGHRKIAISFRNTSLLGIFIASTTTLQSVTKLTIQASAEQLQQMCDYALKLALACLSFDFIGTNIDECSEEVGTIQIPPTWKASFEESENIQLFFDTYKIDLPCTIKALQCLVQIASVRQSLFSGDPERLVFLNCLITNTRAIMGNQIGLNDPQKLHEFCRLLCRIKANFQMSMLVKADGYEEWISLAASISIPCFNSWHMSNNSIFYLLNLWSRFVASIPYLKGEQMSYLDTYVPRIAEAYISSRLASVHSILHNPGQFEDPLDNEEQILQELEHLSQLCRFNYMQIGKLLVDSLNQTISKYTESVLQYSTSRSAQASMHVQLYEGQLAWLVYIVASVVGSQNSGNGGADSHDMMDGELSGIIFQLLVAETLSPQRQSVLDKAILAFLQNFRKKHIGDHAMTSSKVYKRLRELAGLADHMMVMEIIVNRIVTNCKIWASDEDVIHRTLELLSELATGYSSGKMLLRISNIHYLLQNHSPETFPFLLEPCNRRHRTEFYQTLSRLLFLDENTSPDFDQFVAPLTRTFQLLASVPSHMWREDTKVTLAGLFRDVRGILSAAVTRRSYMMVFDWLYPTHFPVFLAAAQHFYGDPTVANPLLKCLCECTHNRAQRMTFDPSSPNGILLFRETSKILVSYAKGILSTRVMNDVYVEKYKGIGTCFQITSRVMSGNYVNFGVFELYGDRALADALAAVVQLFVNVPLDDLMSYTKISVSCFQMIEVLFRNHTQTMLDQDPITFNHFTLALQNGLKSPRPQISTQCSGALDHMCTHCFKLMGKDSPAARSVNRHLQAHPDLFSSFTGLIFNMIIMEEVVNQWSLSRPLLALILIDQPFFTRWKEQLIAAQPPQNQPMLTTAFVELMQDVNCNLETKNRDKFTQNLTLFRHSIKTFM
eukprot:c6710_g1_i1.p1 GENE.c6710_g1_i1~~c6710_g1_i1.p1  ORF type:complete len:1067 (-),score=281.24 c6710_g1_i1:81-3281(-)